MVRWVEGLKGILSERRTGSLVDGVCMCSLI